MSARTPHPRSLRQHELVASEVLNRYSVAAGWIPDLPVPVELIIERSYDLRISWEVLPEGDGDLILGALDPRAKTILMNETHAESVLSYIGPRQFTFAHELGHWIYDAVAPEQGTLFDDVTEVFCRGASSLTSQQQLRETNANKFAAALLLPATLVSERLPNVRTDDALRRCARDWGVSIRTLEIRIDELETPPGQVDRLLI